MEALCLWVEIWGFQWSYEFEVYVWPEGIEYEAEKMDGIFGGAWLRVEYHPGKANVVTIALSRKSLHMSALMLTDICLIEQFIDLSLVCELTPKCVKLGMSKLTNNVLEENSRRSKMGFVFVR